MKFSEIVERSIDRFRVKMTKQITEKKFHESFARVHARVNTMKDASLFEFVKSSLTAILVYQNNSSYSAALVEYYKNVDTWQKEVPGKQSSMIFFLDHSLKSNLKIHFSAVCMF